MEKENITINSPEEMFRVGLCGPGVSTLQKGDRSFLVTLFDSYSL